jgi:purine-nucleoside phosphorylase
MIYEHILSANRKYGIGFIDIVKSYFNCEPDEINETVIIAPSWYPDIFANQVDSITQVLYNHHLKIWNVVIKDKAITYIVTGVGAPKVIETVLTLGCTACENIIFIGSVGGLAKEFLIGDIVIPEYSICGDGSCRYLTNTRLSENDCFGQKYYPNKELYEKIVLRTELIAKENNVNWHIGKNYSVDTVIAQFAHLDEIIDMGCNCIEMETAVLFKSADICGIKSGAVFSVSDNTLLNKSLLSGRSKEEVEYRKFVRDTTLTKIVLDCILC